MKDNEDIILFADNTAIFIYDNDKTNLLNKAGKTMESIYDWYLANKLTISLQKSNFIIFDTRKKMDDIQMVKFGSHSIQRVSSVKYIGLTIDENLTWKAHIQNVITQLNKFFGVFYNIRHVINDKLKRIAYFTCIYSRIKYGLEIYGKCTKQLVQKLQITQNKLLRTIMSKSRMHSVNDLHKTLNVLKVDDAQKLSTICFVFKCLHSTTDNSFHNYFSYTDHIHNTRQQRQLKLPRAMTNLGQSTLKCTGSSLWNNLPMTIRLTNDLHELKHHIRDIYVKNYN